MQARVGLFYEKESGQKHKVIAVGPALVETQSYDRTVFFGYWKHEEFSRLFFECRIQLGQVWEDRHDSEVMFDVTDYDFEVARWIVGNGNIRGIQITESTILDFYRLRAPTTNNDRFPSKCLECGSPAYLAFNFPQCTNSRCRHYTP